jgi:hypothetical protein
MDQNVNKVATFQENRRSYHRFLAINEHERMKKSMVTNMTSLKFCDFIPILVI